MNVSARPAVLAQPPVFSPLEFRTALGMFATGVTIVATRLPDGTPVGMTVNSFNAVSLVPPLVLWSLSVQASAMPAFTGCSHYTVSVLGVAQKELAERFASRASDRWDGVATTEGIGGVPLITGAVATFECSNRSRYAEGDHVIFVGEVLRCTHQPQAAPLLFHGGRFYTEHPL
ncbi:MAG: flavin reductase family protein [Pseudomonadota bacterium]